MCWIFVKKKKKLQLKKAHWLRECVKLSVFTRILNKKLYDSI